MKRITLIRKIITASLAVFIFIDCFSVQAQSLGISMPKATVSTPHQFEPPILLGMRMNVDAELSLSFILDTGEVLGDDQNLKETSIILLKYFLAALTVPENEQWVNLSPYEKDRLIPKALGLTDMGIHMLAEDYVLKQLSSSLSNPATDIGKEFWQEIYVRLKNEFGTVDIDTDVINKVWIVPLKADVHEEGDSVFISSSNLQVLMDKDYVASRKNDEISSLQKEEALSSQREAVSTLISKVMRQKIIPQLTREINQGKSFAVLRQMYHSSILAFWFKQKLRESVWKGYIGTNKVNGLNAEDKESKETIYRNYLESFKKGVYNYIREEMDDNEQTVVQNIFSGGITFGAEVFQNLKISSATNEDINHLNVLAQQGRIRRLDADFDYAQKESTLDENSSRNEVTTIYENSEYIPNAITENEGTIPGNIVGKPTLTISGRQSLNTFLKEKNNFSGVITGVLLSQKGGLIRFNGRIRYWSTMAGYGKELVTILMKNGDVISVYDSKGKQLYPFKENFIYLGSDFEDGRPPINPKGDTDRRSLSRFFKEQPDFTGCFDQVRLNNIGGLSKINEKEMYWGSMPGYFNALVRLVFKYGELVAVFGPKGERIYPFQRNLCYLNTDFDDNNLPLNPQGFSERRSLNYFLIDYTDKHQVPFSGVIDRVPLDDDGGLNEIRFHQQDHLNKNNRQIFWSSFIEYRGALVRLNVKEGIVASIQVLKDQFLQKEFKDDFNASLLKTLVWKKFNISFELPDALACLNAVLEDPGLFEKWRAQFSHINLSDETNTLIDATLKVRHKDVNKLTSKELDNLRALNRHLLELAFPRECPKPMTNNANSLLYPYPHYYIYITKSEGDTGESKELLTPQGLFDMHSLNKWFKAHPGFTGFIRSVPLDQRKALRKYNTGYVQRHSFDERNLNYDEIIPMLKDKGYVTEDGYVKNQLKLTDEPVFKDKFVAIKEALQEAIDGIVFYGISEIEADEVDVEMRNGTIVHVTYTKTDKNVSVYPYEKNFIIEGAKYVDGNIEGGRIVNWRGAKSKKSVNRILKYFPNFTGVLHKLQIDDDGALRKLAGERLFWSPRKDLEGSLVNVVMENGKVVAVYPLEGKRIGLFSENQVFIGRNFADCSLDTSNDVINFFNRISLNTFLQKNHPQFDGTILNLKITGRTLGTINGREYNIDLNGLDHVAVELVKGVVTVVYKPDGNIFWVQDKKQRTKEILNELWRNGDFRELIDLFGEESTNRILFHFAWDVSPQELMLFSKENMYKLRTMGPRRTKKLNVDDFLSRLAEINMMNLSADNDFEQTLKQELFQIIYRYLVEDHVYLKTIENAIRNNELNPMLQRVLEQICATIKSTTKFHVKGILKSTKLKFYQRLGIKYILDKKKVLLADKPGLGKTIQALGAAVTANAKKILIVCPKIAIKDVWVDQINSHLSGKQNIFIVRERTDLDNPNRLKTLESSRFIIVNYELLIQKEGKKLREQLKAQGLDFIIIDEAHRIRNSTQFTDAVLDFDAEYKVLLSASALKGRTIDKIFNLLHWLYPHRYPNLSQFYKRFSNSIKSLSYDIQDFMLRRQTDDSLVGLPSLTVEYRPVELTAEQAHLYRIYEQNLIKHQSSQAISFHPLIQAAVDTALIKQIVMTDIETGAAHNIDPGVDVIEISGEKYRIFTDNGNDAVFIRNVIPDRENEQYVLLPDHRAMADINGKKFLITVTRRESHSSKYNALDEIVDQVINHDKTKLVVFCGYRQSVEDLEKRYRSRGMNVLTLMGRMNGKNKILNKFKETKKPTVLICTYHTLGESVSLISANQGVMVDCPWQDLDQIIGRLYRIGQKKEVVFRILFALNTIDDYIKKINEETEMVQKIVLDDIGSIYKSNDELVESYLSENAHRLQERILLETFKKDIGNTNTNRVNELMTEEWIGESYIRFDGNELSIKFNHQDKVVDAKGLFNGLDNLDDEARTLLKNFFLKRFREEQTTDIRIKSTILWHLLKELVPGFANIDYDGHVEFIAEFSAYFLQRLIENPNAKKTDILGNLVEVPNRLFEETVYYLDRSNVLKLFSMMGLLPQTYYYKGDLIKYDAPIRMHYSNNKLEYYDGRIIEILAPRWLQREKLSYAEEARLANQLRMGNRAAEEVLYRMHHKAVRTLARSAKRKVENKFYPWAEGIVEEDDLISYGDMQLMTVLKTYAENEIYRNTNLERYIFERVGPKVFSLAYTMVKEASVSNPDTLKFGKNKTTALHQNDSNPNIDGKVEAKRLLTGLKILLLSLGFSNEETGYLSLYTFEDWTEEELADQMAVKHQRERTKEDLMHIRQLIKKYQESLSAFGEDRLLSIVGASQEKDSDDAQLNKGGVDFGQKTINNSMSTTIKHTKKPEGKHISLPPDFQGFIPRIDKIVIVNSVSSLNGI